MSINGKCHCGNIAVTFHWQGDPQQIPARACGCSFCVKHGAVWAAGAHSKLEVVIREPELVSKYMFGTETATFHICKRCGVVPFVTSEIANHRYAVVNVNTLDGLDRARLDQAPANFEGEQAESRLLRRSRGWIADVQIAES